MRAAISLLLVLLFSMCGAQTQSTQTEVQPGSQGTGAAAAAEVSTQLDFSTKLEDLRLLVAEHGIILQYTQNDIKVLEAENAAMLQRLAVSEYTVQDLERALEDTKAEMKTEVDNLKKENAAQETELIVLKTRLAAAESAMRDLNTTIEVTVTEMEVLKMDSAAHEQELAALKTRLAASETAVDDLKKENVAQEAELTAVKTRLAATETEVENLEKEIKAAPKVAFSAGLEEYGHGFTHSGSNDMNLEFKRVITNVGEAYSSTTGFFTAPVRGVYYFRFTVADNLDKRYMYIRMHKNGEMLMQLGEYDTDGQPSYLSSGLALQLEKGDTVNMVLPAGYRLYDYAPDSRSTFTGFLLFPL